jgi:hypothetical protein
MGWEWKAQVRKAAVGAEEAMPLQEKGKASLIKFIKKPLP